MTEYAAHITTAEWERSPGNPEIVITTVAADGGADGETVEQFPIGENWVVTLHAHGYRVGLQGATRVETGYYICDVSK